MTYSVCEYKNTLCDHKPKVLFTGSFEECCDYIDELENVQDRFVIIE